MFRHKDLKVILVTILTFTFILSVSLLPAFAQDSGEEPLPDQDIQTELTGVQPEDDLIDESVDPDSDGIPEIVPDIESITDEVEIVQPSTPAPAVVRKIDDFKVGDFPHDSGGVFLLTWSYPDSEKDLLSRGESPDYIYRIYHTPDQSDIVDGNINFETANFQGKDFASTLMGYRRSFWRNKTDQNFHAHEFNVPDLSTYENVKLTNPQLVSQEEDAFVYELSRVGRSRQLRDAAKALATNQANPNQDDPLDTSIMIEVNGFKSRVKILSIENSKVVLESTTPFPDDIKTFLVPRYNPEGQAETYPDFVNTHFFQLVVVDSNGILHPVSSVQSGKTVSNFFHGLRWNNMLIAVIFCITVLWFIATAKKGKELFIRKIAGLDAVDEAIGRATEMGKPILYLTGLDGMSNISTLAAVNILGQVARKVADYDSTIINPNRDPIVMSVCQEVVKEAYMDAGRPDAYNPDSIFFITEDQFSFAAAVSGIMVREKPATNVFMGYYYAESLILAETGGSTGAIQIAGTDSLAQLPFFITTCDYTLIGEELFAASGYLSREPKLLGSMKGQDAGKFFFMITLFIGVILITINSDWTIIRDLFQAD